VLLTGHQEGHLFVKASPTLVRGFLDEYLWIDLLMLDVSFTHICHLMTVFQVSCVLPVMLSNRLLVACESSFARPTGDLLNAACYYPHRSTAYVDAAYSYRLSSVLCESVYHDCEPAKTAEPVKLLFGSWIRVGPRNLVLHGVQILLQRGNSDEEGAARCRV